MRGSLGDSPEDIEEESEDGGRDHEAEPETGAAARLGALIELEGFREGREREGAAQQEEGLLLLRQSLRTLEETVMVAGGPGLVVGWRREESVVADEDGGEDTETEEELNSEGEEVGQEWHPD